MKTFPEHGSVLRGSIGTQVTDGGEPLLLTGPDGAVIKAVRSIGGEAGLKFLGAKLAGPERKLAGWTQLNGFPPTKPALGQTIDAVGARIDPYLATRAELGYELLLGYEVLDEVDMHYRTRVEVDYEINDELFVYSSEAQLVYCPASMETQDCFDAAS